MKFMAVGLCKLQLPNQTCMLILPSLIRCHLVSWVIPMCAKNFSRNLNNYWYISYPKHLRLVYFSLKLLVPVKNTSQDFSPICFDPLKVKDASVALQLVSLIINNYQYHMQTTSSSAKLNMFWSFEGETLEGKRREQPFLIHVV